MLYHPTKTQHIDPKTGGLEPADVWMTSDEGQKLHGWHFRNDAKKKPKALIVFFHGNAENLSSHFTSLAWILPFGYDYFIWDYRGYGKSEGSPSPENTVKDGVLAIRQAHQLAQKAGKDVPLIVFAQSLGGAVALRSLIELKKEIPVRLIVVDSTFQSYQSAGRAVLSGTWLTWLFQPLAYVLLSDRWAPENRVAELAPTPLVVMHGDRDRAVHYDLGEDLFKSAGEPKEFWKVDGGRHIDAFWRHGTTYRERFVKRLNQALAK